MRNGTDIFFKKKIELKKEYIAYRYYESPYNMIAPRGYERIELTKAELPNYLEKHLGELKNIEIFRKENRVPITININMEVGHV